MRWHIAFVAVLIWAWTPAGLGQQIFSDPKNLEVLPKDISPAELRATMRSFALSTGLRCNDCHAGEPDEPLTRYDFASDDKEKKRIARAMLRMTNAINAQYIAELGRDRMQVTCVTCHRGLQDPRTTTEVLTAVLAEEGADAAVARYRELRGTYHGTHSYDFSEDVLTGLAQFAASDGRPDAARTLLTLNLEFFPDSFATHFHLAEVEATAGNVDEARAAYQRALRIGADPQSEAFVQRRLEALGKGTPEQPRGN